MAFNSSWGGWGSSSGWGAWDDGWTHRDKGKFQKGAKKSGKGKWKAAPEEGDGDEWQAATDRTGRILSRYQFTKSVLKTFSDTDGSAFVKDAKRQLDDLTFLGAKHLKKALTAENHHLLRRPSFGLSEAGSIQAGTAVLQSMGDLDFSSLAAALLDPDIGRALATLNTFDTTVEATEANVAEALAALRTKLATSDTIKDLAAKCTVAASRLYLMGIHLLPLLTGLDDPDWWCSHLSTGLPDNKKVQSWRKSPTSPEKMQAALAALVVDRIEDAAGSGKNDPASLFAHKPKPAQPAATAAPAASDTSSSSSSTKKKKKAKKAKKDKKARKEAQAAEPKETSTNKDKKKKKKRASSSLSKEAALQTGIKVRRVTATSSDGKAVIREDELYDELPRNPARSIEAALKELFAQQSSLGEMTNWNVRALAGDGGLTDCDLTSSTTESGDLALLRKGG